MYDYFYGAEADQFSFYRIPKVLFTEERFSSISAEAKVLYGLLLDRMSLSARNGWLDDEGRVYIIFSVEDIMTSMGCANQKAAKLLYELESKCSLIERKRQGLGKPNLIYVKKNHTLIILRIIILNLVILSPFSSLRSERGTRGKRKEAERIRDSNIKTSLWRISRMMRSCVTTRMTRTSSPKSLNSWSMWSVPPNPLSVSPGTISPPRWSEASSSNWTASISVLSWEG